MWQAEALILGKVLLAMFCGAIIGWEREHADKPAGLRTQMFVAGAAALFICIGDVLVTSFNLDEGSEVIRSDPIRIIEAVITGVSFLGAGTIIHGRRDKVTGITTAASLLFAAGAGVCIALSLYALGFALSITCFCALRLAALLPQERG